MLKNNNNPSVKADFLQGGGEMGRLIRSMDWAQTPLGSPELWPQSLRTTVSLCLSSTFPILIAWGPERVQIYNDAYRPICGEKHPHSMGQRFNECWASALPVVGHIVDKAQGGEGSYIENLRMFLDRYGYLEEAFMTFSFSPIRDESGDVGGLFHPITETTDKMLGSRRTQTLGTLSTHLGVAQSMTQIGERLIEAYPDYELDLPFLLFYEMKEEGRQAQLLCAAGIPSGSSASPSHLDFTAAIEPTWPLAGTRSSRRIETLEGIDKHLRGQQCGPYPELPHKALLLPLQPPGETLPIGFLVAGVSARRALDAGYHAFYEGLRTTVTTAVASVRAYENEQARAAALAELDRAKTAFFSNVSHEFRTPLTLMLGPVEDSLLDADQPLPPRQRERQETVLRNSKRLLKLVNTLLDFSRIEAGRTEVQYQPTDLNVFTAELASTFRSLIEKAGLTLTIDCAGLAEPVYVDRTMYEKVVLNLLSNAFKFTFEGGIHVSLRATEGRAHLTIADTGTGIPEGELPHLFERFHRVEGAKGRSYEGSGIGLALVQELAGLHGGSIAVDSQLGKGSHFTVSLPLGTAHLPKDHLEGVPRIASAPLSASSFLDEASGWLQGTTSSSSDSPQAVISTHFIQSNGHARILLADDNADMREYVRRLLIAQGWQVDAVSNGQEALLQAQIQLPDLVISDVMMPGLNGFELLEALRRDEKARAVPVILLSARAGEAASVEAMQRGADDYLVKPFSGKELVARVGARLEIARVRAEVVKARARLHEQFMQAPLAMSVVSGPKLVYELANPLYLEVMGRKNIVGRSLRDAFPEFPSDAPLFQVLEEVFRSGVPFNADEFCIPVDRPNSSTPQNAYFKFTSQPVRDSSGTVTDIMTVAVDVTAQVHAKRRSESLLEELKLADLRKDEFLAMLAHELRNPMAAINTALSLLERSEGDVVKMAKHRDTARRQMGNLVRLVDDLLDVARITRGKVELRKETVDLAALVQNALTAVHPTIESYRHEVSVTFASGPFRIDADPTRLEQVLVNLLTNAAKYTEPGGCLIVRLTREETKGVSQAVLSVRDTGRGIPSDMLENVFDLFVQVAPTIDRRAGGLGLGLTLVKRLVELHGGAVSAHSAGKGKGSEFVVRIPLLKDIHASAHQTAQSESKEPIVSRKRRILLVEDSDDVRESLKDFLEALGHEVAAAQDGLEGLSRIFEFQPDVALIDVGLPSIDGYEVARRVRAEPGGEKFYLVALTGYGGSGAKAKAEEAGFDLHLTKPINIDELPQVLSRTRSSKAT